MSRTLVICKPDAVERGLVGQIIARFEARQLKIAAAKLITIGEDLSSQHYAEHDGKPFYKDLVEFIGRSPSMVLAIEGPENTFAVVRKMMGETDPKNSPPGTIRGDFGLEIGENLVHGSDSEESAQRELSIFFPEL